MARAPRRFRRFLLASLIAVGAAVGLGVCDRPRPSEKTQAESESGHAADGRALADVVADAIVVDLRDGATRELLERLDEAWGVALGFNSIEGAVDGVAVARVDPARRDALLAQIRASPEVEAAEPLTLYHARFVPDDPQFKAQWNFAMLHLPEAWDRSRGRGVVVAVLDTGVAYEDYGEFRAVPDLRGASFAPGYDFVNDDEHPNDDHGHGTHVAGTIAQRTNNGEGVAGIAFEATLMPLKVLDANGTGTSADIADAIRWAVDHGARVLNLSLGGGARSEVMARAVAYARRKGALVVCAAGNAGRGVVEYPAAYPGALAVSAVGPSGALAAYSSFGQQVALAAPGGDTRARAEDGILQNTIDRADVGRSRYAWFQGTSMAAPHVSGVAALLFAAGADSPEEVEEALFEGAAAVGGEGARERYGHGVVDARGALEALGSPPGGLARPLLGLALAVGLWLLMGRTLPRRRAAARRGGFATDLGFWGALVVAAAGLFFLPWAGAHAGVARLFARPLPDWGAHLLGGAAAPLFASAVIPLGLAALGLRRGPLRGGLCGLATGTAASLLWRAATGAPAGFLPWTAVAVGWWAINALLALALARALMREEGGA